jgi:farnesyl diphosphate synthase
MKSFKQRAPALVEHVGRVLDQRLPAAGMEPVTLHQAMRYAVLGDGKRIRPLLCHAAGEALGIRADTLDDAASAVELIHAFSLVHDDLPAMDDDALRRGRPSLHKAFDVATAILAGDALQTLAFTTLARRPEAGRLRMVKTLAEATGSAGMTGGQAIDLAAEGRHLSLAELKNLHHMKTGCLIRAAVLMACDADEDCADDSRERLTRFADDIGLAFQIRDDILDVEGDTTVIGKARGADAAHGKSTYPALMGLEEAKTRADALHRDAIDVLRPFGENAEGLCWMAGYIVRRER